MTGEFDPLQAMIDANDQPVFALDRELRYTAFNRAHAKTMRALYGAEIELGERLTGYQTVVADRESATANLERALAGEYVTVSAFSGEEGQRRYFDVTHTPQTDAAGSVVGVVVSAYDVSARQRTEDALRESEERYRLPFEQMLEGFAYCRMLYDEEGRPDDFVYLAVNPAFERLTGLSHVVGKRVSEVIPTIKAETPEVLETYGRVARTGEPAEFEIDFTPLGIWYHVSAVRPEVDHFMAVFTDVSERKRTESALKENRALLQAVVDGTTDAIYVKDIEGRYLLINAAAARFLGKGAADILGKDDRLLFPPEEATGVMNRDRRVMEAAATESYEETVSDAAGRPSTFLATKGPVFNDGELLGLFGISRDITARKQAEDEIRRQAGQLRRALEGTVLAMSHMVEARDPYTAGHERRVAELAMAIAAEMGMTGESLEALRLGSLVHDIGKIAVPAEILSKPGRLSAMEFELVKVHTRAAYDILQPIDFEFPVADIVVQHHERLDGSGYPAGLPAESILPEARILAVADVVEAMISHRPYRPALPLETAMAELDDGAGSRYDAAACDAAKRVFREEGFAFRE